MSVAARRIVHDRFDRVTTRFQGGLAGALRTALIVGCQLVGLWALYLAGAWFVAMLDLPVPGNLMGLVALYALVSLRVVKAAWFEPLASGLIKHLAFFFIPITVGLIDVAGFLFSHAVAIAAALFASAAVGILLAGMVSQTLIVKSAPSEDP
jgi:holin-like protein